MLKHRPLLLALLLAAAGALLPPAANGAASPPATTPGYSCVFMGHSFFFPVAEGFSPLARAAGFTNHTQVLLKAGGTNGTPGALWSRTPRSDPVWNTLATKPVDLLAFTYHFNGCEVEDYARWIDYALPRNPSLRIAIAIPWINRTDLSPDAFSALCAVVEADVHRIVDALRVRYPGNAVFAIPHGRGVAELYGRFKAGTLPEIQALFPTDQADRTRSFFTDKGGHAGRMPIVLSQLIWLAAIYRVDVRDCAWDTGYKADLKTLAREIVEKDPYTRPAKESSKP